MSLYIVQFELPTSCQRVPTVRRLNIFEEFQFCKCYTTSEVVLCPKSLLLRATHTDWLCMAWTPRSRLTFQRNHKRVTDCNGLKPLLHLGAHYYLSTTLHTITLHTEAGTTSHVTLTPLSIFHVPCNSSFEDQEIGLDKCPQPWNFLSLFFSRINFLRPLVACHK